VGFRYSTREITLVEAGNVAFATSPSGCHIPRQDQKQKKVEMTEQALFFEDSSCYNLTL
jgi:ketosteroid isomerase-like protein